MKDSLKCLIFRCLVQVPDAIKAQYKFPPPLLPALSLLVEHAACCSSASALKSSAEEQEQVRGVFLG